MKVLESRQVTNEVTLMTWSPKMDILAIANAKPEVVLHRLAWQRVWALGGKFGRTGFLLEVPIPKFLTFHPEGLYLAIGFDHNVTLVEVETGNVITGHDIPFITAVKWKSTNYTHSLKDVFSTDSERLESNLTILLIGVQSGDVHIYSGAGRLYTVTLKMTNPYPCQVLDIEIPSDFSSVQVIASNQCDSSSGNVLSLYHFDCYEYAFHGDILGVFAAKAISYRRYLAAIEQDIAAVHENWGIIVEVYKHYLSYGSGAMTDSIKADYAELLVTGVCSAEVEMFLGSGGREKEAKKYLNTLHGAESSFNEALKNIKCNIISLLRELIEITGYHSYVQITQVDNPGSADSSDEPLSEGSKILVQLRELLSLLYHGAVHAQHTAEKFLASFFNFITLLVNTIHSFSVIESPELPEEEADPDRVFELLRFKVARHIFEMVEINPEDARSKSLIPEALTSDVTFLPFGIIPPALKQTIPRMTQEELGKFYDEPNIIDIDEISPPPEDNQGGSSDWPLLSKFLKQNGLKLHTDLLNSPNSELQRMLMTFTPQAEQLIQALLKIPMLDSEVSKKNYILNYFEGGELEKHSYGIVRDPNLPFTYVFHKESDTSPTEPNRRVWLYKLDTQEVNPTVTTALLTFSESLLSTDFLNFNVFSILCYIPQTQPPTHQRSRDDIEPLEIPGNSVLCHIDLVDTFQELPLRSLRIPKTCTTIPNKWTEIEIKVPTDVTVPGPIEHAQIVQILPIANYHPILMALSGARRVGALLDTTKRVIQLLDMDLECNDNSVDLDTTADLTADDVRDLTIE